LHEQFAVHVCSSQRARLSVSQVTPDWVNGVSRI